MDCGEIQLAHVAASTILRREDVAHLLTSMKMKHLFAKQLTGKHL